MKNYELSEVSHVLNFKKLRKLKKLKTYVLAKKTPERKRKDYCL